MRQRTLAVERGKMGDAGAGLQRSEEIDRMVRRVAEKQRDRCALTDARAQERGSSRLGQIFQLDIADGAVAEFDRRPRAELSGGFRQQPRQRSAFDRIVPADAWRIKWFAGMDHGHDANGEESRMPNAPLPLVGRGWGWGYHEQDARDLPPSLTLPHKGGGNRVNVPMRTITPLSPSAPATQTSCPRRPGA